MSESIQDPNQLVRAYAELWNEQDYAGIPEVVSESYVHTGPVEVSALAKLRIEDEKITAHREFHNQLEILEQLGAVEH